METFGPDTELELPEELREFAFEKYGETPEVRSQKLNEMRELIAGLPEQDRIADVSDLNLIRFLRVRKFIVEKAVENTVNYKHFADNHPHLMGGTPKEFERYHDFVQILSERDSEGRTVLIMRARHLLDHGDVEFNNQHPIGKCQVMVLDRLSRNSYVQVKGLVVIGCFVGITFRNTLMFSRLVSVGDVSSVMSYLSKCVGVPMKRSFIIQPPTIMHVIFNVARMFLKEKMRERIAMYSDNTELLEYVKPNSILPKILGGDLDDTDAISWVKIQIERGD